MFMLTSWSSCWDLSRCNINSWITCRGKSNIYKTIGFLAWVAFPNGLQHWSWVEKRQTGMKALWPLHPEPQPTLEVNSEMVSFMTSELVHERRRTSCDICDAVNGGRCFDARVPNCGAPCDPLTPAGRQKQFIFWCCRMLKNHVPGGCVDIERSNSRYSRLLKGWQMQEELIFHERTLLSTKPIRVCDSRCVDKTPLYENIEAVLLFSPRECTSNVTALLRSQVHPAQKTARVVPRGRPFRAVWVVVTWQWVWHWLRVTPKDKIIRSKIRNMRQRCFSILNVFSSDHFQAMRARRLGVWTPSWT